MINPNNLNIIGSVLTTVTASGVDASAASDLLLPIGKTIAELLYDQEKTDKSISIIIQEEDQEDQEYQAD